MSNAKFRLTVNSAISESRQITVYKPVIVRRGLVSLDFIAGMIADKSSQSRADVISTTLALAQEMHRWICDGYAVDLGPLGRFEQILRSRVPITDPGAMQNGDVQFGRIFYRPEATILRSLKQQAYVRDRSKEVLLRPDDEARRELVMGLLSKNPSITATQVMREAGMRFVHAQALLQSLVAEGRVRAMKLSHMTHYFRV